jgi:hypothetical protein
MAGPTDPENEKLASLGGTGSLRFLAGSLRFLALQFELGHKPSENITCQKNIPISKFRFLI